MGARKKFATSSNPQKKGQVFFSLDFFNVTQGTIRIRLSICITKANLSKMVVPVSRQNQRVSEGLSRLK